MKKHIISAVMMAVLGLYPILGFAQKVDENIKQAEKIARKGDKHFKNENYFQALEEYQQALKLDSNNVRALTNGGVANLMLYASPLAVTYLKRAYALNPQFDQQMHYWLGRAYHLTHQPDQAINEYLEYMKLLPVGDARRQEIGKLLSEARFLKIYMDNSSEILVQNLGDNVNSKYYEYSPILTEDGKSMIFTSRRTEEGDTKGTSKNGEFERMFSAKKFFDGSWSKSEPVKQHSASKKKHISGVQLFDNDQKLLVYNSSKFGSLLAAERNGDGWSEPVALNKHINTSDYESSGFVNSRDSTIYFSSSRGSKDGNLDLFVSRKEADGKWGEPQRLPGSINTDYDEEAPFLSKDGLYLYFSSRGHDGMGGYDVYRCRYNPGNRSWSRPINLGYPINSAADDIYYVTDDSTGIGFLSSSRMGTLGRTDIYRVKPLESVLINGYVTHKATKKPLPGYAIQLTSLVSKEIGSSTTLTGREGQYNVKARSKNRYRLDIISKGEVVLSDELEIPLVDRENVKIIRDYEIDAPLPPAPEVAKRLTVENLNLMRITYQEFDTLLINGTVRSDSQALAGAQVQLREESSATPLYTTTTDSRGNYRFGFIPGKQEDYVVEIQQPGYQLASVVVLYTPENTKSKVTSSQFKNVNVVDLSTLMVPITLGAKSVLGGVYFDFNDTRLKPESSVSLDRLYTFLSENPTIRMEIGGHADNVGTSYVNRVFSQKRAQAVVNYLVDKGIEKGRLSSKGYGEDAPLTTNASELNGRDVNRRIEMKITGI